MSYDETEQALAMKYLYLIGRISRAVPQMRSVQADSRLRPRWFFRFQNLINQKLTNTTWTISGDVVEQEPRWNEKKDLVRLAKIRSIFPGEEEEVENVIRRARRAGYLTVNDRAISVTTKMLRNLMELSSGVYSLLAKRPPPAEWDMESHDWVRFNNTMFNTMTGGLGGPWRHLRQEINDAISAYKSQNKNRTEEPRSYYYDYLGLGQPRWIVANIAILLGPINRYECYKIVRDIEFHGHADDTELAGAIEELYEWGVVAKNGDEISLAPRFGESRATFMKAVFHHIPLLEAAASEWRPTK